jgi:hypothetical protein
VTTYIQPGQRVPPCKRYYATITRVAFDDGPADREFDSDKDEHAAFDGVTLTITQGTAMNQVSEVYPVRRVGFVVTRFEERVATHSWEETVLYGDTGPGRIYQLPMFCETCNTVREATGEEYNAHLDAEVAAGRAVAEEVYESDPRD